MLKETPMKSFLSTVLGVLLITGFACNHNLRSNQNANKLDLSEAERLQSKQIVESVCYECHHPTAAPDNRIAPPLEIAKRNYLASSSSKAEFVQMMTNFIKAPSEEDAVLHGEVEDFGLMDQLGYSETQIRDIAIFIYETDLEKPDWLE